MRPTYLNRSQSQLVLQVAGWADLNLLGPNTDPNGQAYELHVIDDGNSTWDTPQPVDVTVQRWMTDGAVASTQSHDNRTIAFRLRVRAATDAALAAGEAALAQRASQGALLVYTPAEGTATAPSTVFEVWTWHLAHDFDASGEQRLTRYYTVSATAKPWARSLNSTTLAATTTSSSPTVTSIDTCSSLTGWNGAPNTPFLVLSNTAIREQMTAPAAGGGSQFGLQLNRSATVSGLSGVPYLVIDITLGGAISGSPAYSVAINTTTFLTKVAQVGSSTYWALPPGTTSFSNLLITAIGRAKASGGAVNLTVGDVSSTTAIGGIGSAMQLARSLSGIGGSVPTAGSIQLASPSATALGNVLVYTCPDPDNNYSPPMRPYRTSGNTTTADAAAVSGFHEAFVTAGASAGLINYTVPSGQLQEGTYAIVARVNLSATTTISFTITASVTGYTTTQAITLTTGSLTSGWQWVILGVLNLPAQTMPAESTVSSTFVLTGTCTPSATVTLDEWYVLDVTHGDYTLLNSTQTRVWLDAPDADPVRNRPAVYLGTQADRSDAVSVPMAQVMALGSHSLDSGGAYMLTVTDGVANTSVTATFYRRWHTHAGS